MANTDESKARRVKGSVPPKIDLGAAVDLITELYERAGGSSSFDELSEIMRNSRSSSAFQQKLTALRSFGLIETDNERVSLTPNAERIVAPQDANVRAAALKEAFLAVDPFTVTYAKYIGKILPQDEFLKNSFLEYGRDLAETWMRRFKASAETAGLLMDRGDGKLQVRESGKTSAISSAVTTPLDRLSRMIDGVAEPEVPTRAVEMVEAKQAKSEYEMLIDILSADMTDEEQAAVWTLIQFLKKKEASKRSKEGASGEHDGR